MDLNTAVDRFYAENQGKSLLYAPNAAREYLRGQCVQSVCFYVTSIGKPVIWADAAEWWYKGLYKDQYDYIANSATAVPQKGDIIIWDRNLANSGGAGHIAVVFEPRPGTGTFVSVDQNWGGKTVHLVTHNYYQVVGWLRPKFSAPAPQPAPAGGTDMANRGQVDRAYNVVLHRPGDEGGLNNYQNKDLNGTINDMGNSAEWQSIDQKVKAYDAITNQLNDARNTINQLNQTVTNLNVQLGQANSDDAADKKKIEDALAKISDLTAQLETKHDEISDVQNDAENVPNDETQKPSLFIKFLAAILRKK